MTRLKTLEQRIERYIERIPFSGCWIWMGCLDTHGYGQTTSLLAHRVIYKHLRGQIPSGKELDHLCRIRCCVNPDHLEVVTKEINQARGAWRNKPACAKGHLFDKANTGKRKNGNRYCITCQRAANKAAYKKRVDARANSLA